MVVAEANTMVSQFSLKKPRILFTSFEVRTMGRVM